MEGDHQEDADVLGEMEDEDELEHYFECATQFMKTVAGDMDKTKLLYFYARFKQATQGKCSTPRPGMFDFQGKQKWDAWNSLKDMSQEQAMTEYMSAMDEVDPDWVVKVKGQRSSSGGLGIGVSTMMAGEEEELSDNQKSIYDWCKEGNIDQLRLLLSTEGSSINKPDDDGLTLLHWACDRGHSEVVSLLIEQRASVNAVDTDKQTPLHYACTCEHLPIIEILVQSEADVNAKDCDGNTPADNTYKKNIHEILGRKTSDVR